ncbi:potassium uptake protein TrkA, partial [gut metagenome]
ACAYPLGVVGIICAMIAIRYFLRIKLEKEEEQIRLSQEDNPHAKPHHFSVRVENQALEGKTFEQLTQFIGRTFVCTHYKHGDDIFSPNKDTIISLGDEMNAVCASDDVDAIIAFIGSEITVDWQAEKSPIISKRILVTQPEVNGKTFGQMHFRSLHGVNVTRITRTGMDLFADRSLRIPDWTNRLTGGWSRRLCNPCSNASWVTPIKRLDHPQRG